MRSSARRVAFRAERSRGAMALRSLKDARAARADEHLPAGCELQFLGLVARDLRPEVAPVLEHELDPHLEPEMDDALDRPSGRLPVRFDPELEVVWAHERLSEAVHRPDEAHHE